MRHESVNEALRTPTGTPTRLAVAALAAGGLATTLGVTGASGALHSSREGVVISTYKSAKFGTILVDGTTLYTLKPNADACTATCHKYWVAVLLPKGVAGRPPAPGWARPIGFAEGRRWSQVTYAGKTLFWYFQDKSLGQVTGNVTDTWGKWLDVVLVKPVGAADHDHHRQWWRRRRRVLAREVVESD